MGLCKYLKAKTTYSITPEIHKCLTVVYFHPAIPQLWHWAVHPEQADIPKSDSIRGGTNQAHPIWHECNAVHPLIDIRLFHQLPRTYVPYQHRSRAMGHPSRNVLSIWTETNDVNTRLYSLESLSGTITPVPNYQVHRTKGTWGNEMAIRREVDTVTFHNVRWRSKHIADIFPRYLPDLGTFWETEGNQGKADGGLHGLKRILR